MTEEAYTVKQDIYGDYAIFKDVICIVSDIEDKQLAETLCTRFNLWDDERKGFIEFIQHQNEQITFLENKIIDANNIQKAADHISNVARKDREYAERLYKENMEIKKELIEVLQKNYYYAYNKRQKNLDDVKIAHAYAMLIGTVKGIAEDMEVDLDV